MSYHEHEKDQREVICGTGAIGNSKRKKSNHNKTLKTDRKIDASLVRRKLESSVERIFCTTNFNGTFRVPYVGSGRGRT